MMNIYPLESTFSNTTHDCKYVMPEEVSTALNSPNGLSLFCINCQSLNAHFTELKNLLPTLSNNTTFKFDVI